MYFCPKCKNEIIKSYPSGKLKLRTNIVIFENGKAFCKCQQCHADVAVPIELKMSEINKKMKYYVIENVNSEEVNKSAKKDKGP